MAPNDPNVTSMAFYVTALMPIIISIIVIIKLKFNHNDNENENTEPLLVDHT